MPETKILNLKCPKKSSPIIIYKKTESIVPENKMTKNIEAEIFTRES